MDIINKAAEALIDKATANKVLEYQKKWGNDKGHPIITKQMRTFQQVCIDICTTEERTCSVMEIAQRMNIDTSTAYRLKERCVSAGLIEFRLGRHGSLKPTGYTIPTSIVEV